MNSYTTRKSNKQETLRHQDDVISSVREYSTWQGKALTLALIVIAVVLVKYVLPAVMLIAAAS